MSSKEIRKIADEIISRAPLPKYQDPEFYTSKLEDDARDQLGISQTARPVKEAYLTDKSGSSNKYHYFVLFQDGEEFTAANVYGRIGVTSRAHEIARGGKYTAISAYKDKMSAKVRKGYEVEYEK